MVGNYSIPQRESDIVSLTFSLNGQRYFGLFIQVLQRLLCLRLIA